jgi:hypothetical protein
MTYFSRYRELEREKIKASSNHGIIRTLKEKEDWNSIEAKKEKF